MNQVPLLLPPPPTRPGKASGKASRRCASGVTLPLPPASDLVVEGERRRPVPAREDRLPHLAAVQNQHRGTHHRHVLVEHDLRSDPVPQAVGHVVAGARRECDGDRPGSAAVEGDAGGPGEAGACPRDATGCPVPVVVTPAGAGDDGAGEGGAWGGRRGRAVSQASRLTPVLCREPWRCDYRRAGSIAPPATTIREPPDLPTMSTPVAPPADALEPCDYRPSYQMIGQRWLVDRPVGQPALASHPVARVAIARSHGGCPRS